MNFDKKCLYRRVIDSRSAYDPGYRQFADLLYADLPANAAYQRMHIYAPRGFMREKASTDIRLRLLRSLCRIKSHTDAGRSWPRREKRRKAPGSRIRFSVRWNMDMSWLRRRSGAGCSRMKTKPIPEKRLPALWIIRRRCVICMHLPRICRAMRKRLSQTGQVRAAHCLRWSAVQETTRIMSRI